MTAVYSSLNSYQTSSLLSKDILKYLCGTSPKTKVKQLCKPLSKGKEIIKILLNIFLFLACECGSF